MIKQHPSLPTFHLRRQPSYLPLKSIGVRNCLLISHRHHLCPVDGRYVVLSVNELPISSGTICPIYLRLRVLTQNRFGRPPHLIVPSFLPSSGTSSVTSNPPKL